MMVGVEVRRFDPERAERRELRLPLALHLPRVGARDGRAVTREAAVAVNQRRHLPGREPRPAVGQLQVEPDAAAAGGVARDIAGNPIVSRRPAGRPAPL